MHDHDVALVYGLDGQGHGELLTSEALSEPDQSQKLIWVHLDANHAEAQAWLQKEASLDALTVKALLAQEARPRVMQIGDGLLFILQETSLDEENPSEMASVRLWINSTRIISCQKQPINAIDEIKEKIKAGQGPKDVGQFIYMLIEYLFAQKELVLAQLDEMSDTVEEKVLESADGDLRETIVQLRKKAIVLRHYMVLQRNALEHLCTTDLQWLDETHKRHLQEAYSHVARYVEELDVIRERTQIVKDELANMLSDRLNKNMYALSVVAAIFLPLGFLTGLLGINLGGIPGTQSSNAFWIFVGLLLLLVLVQVFIFRRLKWV